MEICSLREYIQTLAAMEENPQAFLKYVQSVLAEKIEPGQNEKQEELLKILKARNEKHAEAR